MKKTVHILGAGGIGVALAWSLARAGWDVTVIDADARKVEWGSKEGLTVVDFGTERPTFTTFNEWTPPQNELMLLCTKTYDNPAVLARLQLEVAGRSQGLALLMITHNLGVVRETSDTVYVMNKGEIVEHGPTARIFAAPQQQYSRDLIAAVPRLTGRVAP